MERQELLQKVKARLAKVHGERLHGVVLYGSEARGDAEPESDIDLLVLLEEPIDFARDLEANLNAVYPLSLETGRRISVKSVPASQYDTIHCPLYDNAHKEGIPV